eukprot:GHVT01100801.1.p1 GENE.GHVT01100801.1~~GHVT01100801.1.p1  ORF type:complete len:430 (-),score=25.71 GHVT01100801.1:345-1634(-)
MAGQGGHSSLRSLVTPATPLLEPPRSEASERDPGEPREPSTMAFPFPLGAAPQRPQTPRAALIRTAFRDVPQGRQPGSHPQLVGLNGHLADGDSPTATATRDKNSEMAATCGPTTNIFREAPDTLQQYQEIMRSCFICLDGSGTCRKRHLLSCCSQCYAVVHKGCWQDWRLNQRFATIRARLLGQNPPNPLSCTICKTGTARVYGEEDGMRWAMPDDPVQERLQDQLLQTIALMLNDDEDDEDEPPMCTGLITCLNLVVLFVGTFVNIMLICLSTYYPSDVVLLSLFLLYEFFVVELIILAIWQRRIALGPLLDTSLESEDGDDDSSVHSASSGDHGDSVIDVQPQDPTEEDNWDGASALPSQSVRGISTEQGRSPRIQPRDRGAVGSIGVPDNVVTTWIHMGQRVCVNSESGLELPQMSAVTSINAHP